MKKYKIVDRKAPRFRIAKYRTNIVCIDLYDRFKEANPDVNVTWAEYKKIIEAINEQIVEDIISNRDGVKLPAAMGRIWMGLFKPRERMLNEPYMRNTGEHATHFSFETNGLQGKICWDFQHCRYRTRNYQFYGFIGHRLFKNKASNAFKTRPQIYSRIHLIPLYGERTKSKTLENELNGINNSLDNKASDQSDQSTSQVS